ncbi:hypothetical protein BCR36DRAFT_584061 [Piromyces finnis]|uniref:Uncharacterized protein n=1 Tax=Piromyces finnis TaxID=1754191 RepID=A0A1Y1V7X5_9FUNG|nr:hypothetical protein BCR36DRAFT_584061 [Piromyces finnis]|eukprot:ORX48941.1 hypothetical protein BCR36DRAFT_584061 [Piromyces finnis]
MKFSIKVLFVSLIAGINAMPMESKEFSPKCKAATKIMDSDIKFRNCIESLMEENIANLCPNCKNLSFPDEIETACSSNPEDTVLLYKAHYELKKINDAIDQICSNPSKYIDTDTQVSTFDDNSAVNNDAIDNKLNNNNFGSNTNNATNNGATNNGATNNGATNNGAISNGISDNTASTNTTPGNNTATNANNSDVKSSSSKLSYSLVTVFALVAFNFLL